MLFSPLEAVLNLSMTFMCNSVEEKFLIFCSFTLVLGLDSTEIGFDEAIVTTWSWNQQQQITYSATFQHDSGRYFQKLDQNLFL